MKKEILTVLVTSLGLSGVANAACYNKTCAELGYTQSLNECDENFDIVKCPFDTSKVFCETKEVKCTPGDIYYSDGTCSTEVVSGKTPIGVVGYITDGGKHGGVISLDEKSLKWSNADSNLTCLPDLDSGGASGDMNGVQNTQCIMSQTYDTYPAAAYCNGYAAVSTGKGSKGWYLPAAGELGSLTYSYGAINLGLSKLSKTQLSADWYWSSSEYYYYGAWVVRPSDGNMSTYNKNYNYCRVRCVLAF